MSLHTAVPATPITPTNPYSASILKSPIVSAPSVSDVASSSHVVSSTAPTPGSVVAKARRSKKRRLIHNGANYLREYLASLNGEWPNKRQLVKDRVLEHVQTLCGNEECELDNIVQWFARQKAHQKHSEIRGRPPKEVLKESARTHLDNLLSDTPNPTIQTITSWAGLMGADVSDVMAYIACRSTTRLPTPAESISTSVGAYSPAESPFVKHEPFVPNSPLIGSSHPCTLPGKVEQPSPVVGRDAVLALFQAITRKPDSEQLLLRDFSRALHPQSNFQHIPTSVSEFSQMISAHVQDIQHLLRQIEQGQLSQDGWDSSTVSWNSNP